MRRQKSPSKPQKKEVSKNKRDGPQKHKPIKESTKTIKRNISKKNIKQKERRQQKFKRKKEWRRKRKRRNED